MINTHRIAPIVFLTSATCLLFLMSCSDTGTSSGNIEREGSAKKEISFTDLVLLDKFIPVWNRDSLAAAPLTVDDYLDRKHALDARVTALNQDTTIRPELRLLEISVILRERRALDAHAVVKAWSQCGIDNDLKDIETYTGCGTFDVPYVQEKARPVGLLRWNRQPAPGFPGKGDVEGNVWGAGWGSGFLVSDDLFVTAKHCIATKSSYYIMPQRLGRDLTPAETIPHMSVVFNYQREGATGKVRKDTAVYGIKEIVDERDGLDYVVLRLRPNADGLPGKKLGKLVLAPKGYTVQPNEAACIIQHPTGNFKKVWCGQLAGGENNNIRYVRIDTDFASSGAPLLDRRSGYVLGVHTDGACKESSGYNFGVSAKALREVSKIIP